MGYWIRGEERVEFYNKSSHVNTFADSDHLLDITPLLNADKSLFFAFLEDLSELLFQVFKVRGGRDRNILFNFSTWSKELEHAFGGAVKASVLSV